MNKTTLILSTVTAWLVGCTLYCYYYVVTILSSPEAESYDAYARDWGFQVLMFCIVRLPVLVVALLVTVFIELVALEYFKGRNVQH